MTKEQMATGHCKNCVELHEKIAEIKSEQLEDENTKRERPPKRYTIDNKNWKVVETSQPKPDDLYVPVYATRKEAWEHLLVDVMTVLELRTEDCQEAAKAALKAEAKRKASEKELIKSNVLLLEVHRKMVEDIRSNSGDRHDI